MQTKPLSEKDIENCENLVDKNIDALMVTTRSATEKLNLKHIELHDDDVQSNYENNYCSNNGKLIDYMPNFKDTSWGINELMNKQSNDPFCIQIINLLYSKLISNIKDLNSCLLSDGILYKKRTYTY